MRQSFIPGSTVLLIAVATSVFSLNETARAGEDRFDAAVRVLITAADGEPANDIPGYGVQAGYTMNERWRLGVALDLLEFDFEEPAKIIGIAQDASHEAIDAKAEATTISAWIERRFGDTQSRTHWFAGAGIGASSVDVPDATGRRADGGQFDIHTEVDTEIIASLIAGVRRDMGERWYLEFALRADQHFADWQIADRVSGAQGSSGDYLAWGGQFAVGLRW